MNGCHGDAQGCRGERFSQGDDVHDNVTKVTKVMKVMKVTVASLEERLDKEKIF